MGRAAAAMALAVALAVCCQAGSDVRCVPDAAPGSSVQLDNQHNLNAVAIVACTVKRTTGAEREQWRQEREGKNSGVDEHEVFCKKRPHQAKMKEEGEEEEGGGGRRRRWLHAGRLKRAAYGGPVARVCALVACVLCLLMCCFPQSQCCALGFFIFAFFCL